jgi:steroid 5-alpha reductase family enzyme
MTMTEILLTNAAIILVTMLALWLVATKIGDVSFIDAVWGGGMALLAATAWLQLGEPGPRASLIAAMAVIWGARLAIHLYIRWRASGEDPRYAKILGPARDKGRYASGALKRVFLPQAVLLWITCLPAQMGVAGSGAAAIGPLAMSGAALWLLGIVFETVGDWQLSRFRADLASKGKVLDTGLWRYTRHPNYFGDACVWWGIWLAASEAGWPVALGSLIGPAFLTFTLTKWSGKPLLEKGMADRRPGYADYVRKTSGFVPWFPKK